jgi:hypothetical protein
MVAYLGRRILAFKWIKDYSPSSLGPHHEPAESSSHARYFSFDSFLMPSCRLHDVSRKLHFLWVAHANNKFSSLLPMPYLQIFSANFSACLLSLYGRTRSISIQNNIWHWGTNTFWCHLPVTVPVWVFLVKENQFLLNKPVWLHQPVDS